VSELKVREFMEAMGQTAFDGSAPDDEKRVTAFRIALIDEEYDELIEALNWGDRRFIAKELADLVYVVIGTAVALGIPFDAVFDAVHKSNMSKLDDEGKPYLRADGKVEKGPNYKAPDAEIERLVR
jgi:predicted HAD superfamily Cof-like phosphohydrolase